MIRHSRNVLVVEDNAVLRDGLAVLLGQYGYTVTTAATVAQALAALDGQDAALVDLLLPDGTGDAVLRAIRARELGIRVAAMSAGAVPSVLAALDGCPPDRFFDKPLDITALLEWIAAGDAATAADHGPNHPPPDAEAG